MSSRHPREGHGSDREDGGGTAVPANESTALARLLIDELTHQGVVELVLCPGSRSAPLAFAAAAAERAGRLRLHVRIDERSAAFLALGLAKVSGSPVPVVCTSGSAVANLSPAVVEASFAGVPLIALTADRPLESRGVGAPQTIDQVGFFGSDVRFAVDLGQERRSAVTQQEDLDHLDRATRGAVAAAVAAAVGAAASGVRWDGADDHPHPSGRRRPGPVHINVGFRTPLVPDPGYHQEHPRLDRHEADPARSGRLRHPGHARRTPLADCGSRDLAEVIGQPVSQHGVLLAGDLPRATIAGCQQWISALGAALGWPIISEPTANLHGAPTALDHGVLVLSEPTFLADHKPDLVLSVGAFGLSRATMGLVRAAGRHIAVDLSSARAVCDPLRTAERILQAVPLAPQDPARDPGWLADWRRADSAVGAALQRAGVGDPAGQGIFSGIDAAVIAASSVPRDGLLLVAASWPVRHLEAFAAITPGAELIGNRGANGIDGLVSTAWGAALAHQSAGGGPAYALLGDLAFLHDRNGLLAASGEPEPDLTVVVVDNGGGGIFHQLEQGRPAYAADFERLFGTPHGLDLEAVATSSGRRATTVHSAAELAAVLAHGQDRGAEVRVVIVRVAPRHEEAERLAALERRAQRAVVASQRQ